MAMHSARQWCAYVLLMSALAVHAATSKPQVPRTNGGLGLLSSFGLNTHFITPQPGEFEMIIKAGFQWIRTDIIWADIEKTTGNYTFGAYDSFFSTLNSSALSVIAILSSTNPLYEGGNAPITPAGIGAWARFAGVMAKRYRSELYHNMHIYWELSNEPDISTFKGYPRNATSYARLAVAASKSIHTADRSAHVVGPATSDFDFSFLYTIAEEGLSLLRYVDGVTVHPYRSDAPETALEDFGRLQAMVAQYSLLTKPLPVYSGEWGYAANGFITESLQAELFVRVMLVSFMVQRGVGPSIWYEWKDDSATSGQFGLVKSTYHPGRSPPYDIKPSYTAATVLHKTLAGFDFVQRIPAYNQGANQGGAAGDDFILQFQNAVTGVTTIVAWTISIPHVVRLPGGAGCWHVTSLLGESLPQICEDPRGIHVNVSTSVLYLSQ